jgi:hypothetical protein
MYALIEPKTQIFEDPRNSEGSEFQGKNRRRMV